MIAQVLGEAGSVGVDGFVERGAGRGSLGDAGMRGWRGREIGVCELVETSGRGDWGWLFGRLIVHLDGVPTRGKAKAEQRCVVIKVIVGAGIRDKRSVKLRRRIA